MDNQKFFEKIEVQGWEHLEGVYEAGRGGIFVTGHIGNWELSATFAAKRGYPDNMVRGIRKGQRHLLTFDPPFYADRKAPREEEVRRLVTRYTKRLEEFIREHPDQWVWFHRRWRTQPQLETHPPETFLAQNNIGPDS